MLRYNITLGLCTLMRINAHRATVVQSSVRKCLIRKGLFAEFV